MRVGSEVPNRKTEVFGWGSWTVWSKKKGGAGGGGEWGRGGWVLLEWSRKGGSREGGREWGRGGWVEWEGGQGRRFWLGELPKTETRKFFGWCSLDRVEQEGTGSGGGGEMGAGGGLGGVGGGFPSTAWWECASVSELPEVFGWVPGQGGVGRGRERGGAGVGPGRLGGLGGGFPSAELLMRLSWACALVLKSPTEKRKFLVGVPGQCGSKKRGGGSGAGRGWVLLGVEQEGGEPGPKQKRGSFWLVFLDRVEQEGTGAGGGEWGWGGVGWSGRGVPSTDLFWWDLVGMRVGSELPKTEKRKFFGWVPGQCGVGREGSGGGAGVGPGGWVEWEGGKVEPEGGGERGGGGSGAGGGGLGGVGPKRGAFFWWDLVGMRVGFEPPKTEKQKFVVGVSGQGGAGKAGSGGEAGVALGGLGGWHERLQQWTLRLGSCNAAATQVEMHVHSLN